MAILATVAHHRGIGPRAVNDVLRFLVCCWGAMPPRPALGGNEPQPMTRQAIDLAHLARQTGQDEALAGEVLRLFAARAPADVARLRAVSGPARREVAHLLVGSARAIGAEDVARLAAAIEAGAGDEDALEAAVGEALRFIAGHLEA
jgi:HPt (histidine-containing phosphotransfer) domain-containing protein